MHELIQLEHDSVSLVSLTCTYCKRYEQACLCTCLHHLHWQMDAARLAVSECRTLIRDGVLHLHQHYHGLGEIE